MISFNLDQDEAVIMQTNNVVTGANSRVDLILTNKNLIQINKNLFGSEKNSEKYPLKELKVLNGKANILIEKNKNGRKQLDLYFNEFVKQYCFDGLMMDSKWATAIAKAHKSLIDEIAKQAKTENSGNVLNNLKNTLDAAIKIIPKKDGAVTTCKCPKCGAELTGAKGSNVKCSYCDAIVIVK